MRVAVLLITLLLAGVTLNTATANATKKPTDPVVTIIVSAAKRHKITSADKHVWLHDWAVSERAQRRLATHHRSKAAQIVGARAIATGLAQHHQLRVDQLPLVMSGVHATTDVMLHRGYPAREARIKLAGDAATYGFYPGWGIQIQPLFTFSEGNQLVSLNNTAGVTAIANRMLELDTSRLHYRAWEYAFPWQGAKLPWVSAMTQATAMQFYARAWQLTGKANYLATAKAAMPGFQLDARDGGLMTYQGLGRWFLLYPFNPSQRILNGHLQAMIGLSDYATITGDPEALSLVQDGINAVVPLLSKFDTGAWSRYQYGQEADLGYHDLMTTQLNKLSNRTALQIFRDYGSKFRNYRITPPETSVSSKTSGPGYPIHDGYRDNVRTSWFVDKHSTVRISVVDDHDSAIRTYRGVYSRGSHSFAWDGWTGAHKIAPAGSYHLTISATDLAANSSTTTSATSLVIRKGTRSRR